MLNSPKKTVLIVEDEAEIRDLLATRFNIFGFETHTAASGHSALKVVQSNTIDVLITDLNMPDGNGEFLIINVRKMNPNSPKIFAITGRSDQSLERILAQGADGMIAKPFDARALLNAVRTSTLEISQRWAHPPYALPQSSLKLRFQSLSIAEAQGRLAFGRSGFYCQANVLGANVESLLALDIEAPPISLHGVGVVRWSRTSRLTNTSELGIEIVYVESHSLKLVVPWFKNLLTPASIPSPQIPASMPSKAKLQSTG